MNDAPEILFDASDGLALVTLYRGLSPKQGTAK